MEPIDYWKLCDRITLFQAVMLIVGEDPESHQSWNIEQKASQPSGYGAVKTALLTAIKKEIVEADVCEETDREGNGYAGGVIPGSIDIDLTLVSVASLKKYLKDRNFDTGFFFPAKPTTPDYIDESNACYAPKLAAAVEAWTVVTGEKRFETESTPKQLMEKWLRENATRFGLNRSDGKLNEDGIAQITKIANWRPEGGASRSPGSRNPSTRQSRGKHSQLGE